MRGEQEDMARGQSHQVANPQAAQFELMRIKCSCAKIGAQAASVAFSHTH
jgi:hypothetical protein